MSDIDMENEERIEEVVEEAKEEETKKEDVQEEGANLDDAAETKEEDLPAGTETAVEEDDAVLQWDSFGLDQRILAGIASLGWKEPTEIQEAALPIALKGKDILAKARTGSGKTGAFCIPIIQRLLLRPTSRALIIAPTRELCAQIDLVMRDLSTRCFEVVSVYEMGAESDTTATIGAAVVIGTPGRVVNALKADRLDLRELAMLVLDEADMLFGFGHDKLVKELITYLPGSQQTFLMSATLSEQVEIMKKLTLRNHVTLKLDDTSLPAADTLQQYQINLNADFDKYLVLLAFLKLKIVRGKSLIFVCGTDRSYKLKLFLKQFGLATIVLSHELAATSRHNAVVQFNKGKFDVLIANDQVDLDEEIADGAHVKTAVKETDKKGKDKKGKKSKKGTTDDSEFDLSRGIDFQNVSNVLNFDFPTTSNQYIHRAGRTARGDNKGRVINFMIGPEERNILADVVEITKQSVDQFRFKMDEIEGLRYRANDAIAVCNKKAIRDCRVAEIKQAILNSKKLQEEYFTRNEADLAALRHDTNLKKVGKKSDLASIPAYLVPKQIKNSLNLENAKLQGGQSKNFWKKGLTHKERIERQKKRRSEDPLRTKAKRMK